MKSFITCAILLASMVLTSCATVFPVHNPDMNRDEYAGLIAAESERTVCYEKGFRGGMLFLDFVLGAPFFWTPLIFDAADNCTPPLFDDQPQEKINIISKLGFGMHERVDINHEGDSAPAVAPISCWA